MSLKRKVFIFGSSLTTIVGLLFCAVKLFHARPLHFLAKKDRISASLVRKFASRANQKALRVRNLFYYAFRQLFSNIMPFYTVRFAIFLFVMSHVIVRKQFTIRGFNVFNL